MNKTELQSYLHEEHHGVNIVTVPEGIAMDDVNAPIHRSVLIGLSLDPECTSVVLNISEVESIDSANLAMIVSARKRLRAAEKPFVVDYVGNKHIEKIFKITGLDKVFEPIEAPKSTI